MIFPIFALLLTSASALRISVEDKADTSESFQRVKDTGCGFLSQQIDDFRQTATKDNNDDKFNEHSYQTMYGIFLTQWRSTSDSSKGPKMLEIGLGCDKDHYTPAASVKAFKQIFPKKQHWLAEWDETCVKKARENALLEDVSTVTGDQGNASVLQSWIQRSGGDFDIIIDDGGHKNAQIKTSFDNLWPTLKPGGLYFLEDLQVGRNPGFQKNSEDHPVMSSIIQSWIEQLLIEKRFQVIPEDVQMHPLPEDVHFIFCQREACVLGKNYPTSV